MADFFTLSNYNNIKFGSTEIKKVKFGTDQIWPVSKNFILYQNGVFYEVTDIINNQYVKTEYESKAPLVNITDMMFELGIPVQPKIIFEYCICGFDGVLLYDGRLTKSNSGTANIHNNKSTTSMTWRYMGSGAAGTGSQSLTINTTPIRDIVCNSLIQNDYLCQFMLEPYPNATNRYYKRFYKSTLPNGTPAVVGSNTTSVFDLKDAYIADYMDGYTWKIGDINDVCQRSNGKKFWCNFYYLKVYDYDTSTLMGFYHFTYDNGTLKMYDEVSKTFKTSESGVNASLTKLDKSIEIPGLTPNDYYYVDGTIEINGVTYEKLVNNLDSTKIKKGIGFY